MTWSNCVTGAAYTVAVDWDQDGDFTGTGEDVTSDVLGGGTLTIAYGRDQGRQLSPSAVGRAGFSLCNVDRVYSPENPDSPIQDELGPARDVLIEAQFQGTTYPLHRGRVDDFDVFPDRADRTADFTSLDGLAVLQGVQISTAVYQGLRTGDIVNVILDAAGWPAADRDIDVGASFTRFWWAEGKDAFDALQEIVLAEGPPAIAYVAPDGTFVFRDRHHRLLRTDSLASQGVFSSSRVACDAPVVTGLDFVPPFVYRHGWRDIINNVVQDVLNLRADPEVSVVWSTDSPFNITTGETVTIVVGTDDPMFGAITPGAAPDIEFAGAGTVSVMLDRTSGQSISIMITAVGGDVTVTYLQLRARLVTSIRTDVAETTDAASVTTHGIRTYPDVIQWAGIHDVYAIEVLILAHYAQRRPIVKMRLVSQDPAHLVQVLSRTISDRVTIRNGELGLANDFFVESVAHTIHRIDPGKGPVHYVVLGCEKQLDVSVENPFTFDKVGAGFDDGRFGRLSANDPNSIFIFDHATQGQFDVGVFAN